MMNVLELKISKRNKIRKWTSIAVLFILTLLTTSLLFAEEPTVNIFDLGTEQVLDVRIGDCHVVQSVKNEQLDNEDTLDIVVKRFMEKCGYTK